MERPQRQARTNDIDRVESRRTMTSGRGEGGALGATRERFGDDPSSSQLRPAVPPWTVRRVGSDAVWAMAHQGDAGTSLAPGPSPTTAARTTPEDPPEGEVASVSVGRQGTGTRTNTASQGRQPQTRPTSRVTQARPPPYLTMRCPIYPGQGGPSRIGVTEWSRLCRASVASIRLNSRMRPFGR